MKFEHFYRYKGIIDNIEFKILTKWQDKFNATIYNIDPKKWVDQKSFQDDLNSFVDEAIRASELYEEMENKEIFKFCLLALHLSTNRFIACWDIGIFFSLKKLIVIKFKVLLLSA